MKALASGSAGMASPQIRAAQLAQYCNSLPSGLGSSLLLALIYVATLWASGSTTGELPWLGAIAAITAVRALLWLRYRRTRPEQTGQMLALAWPLRLASLVSGLIWGSTTIFLFSEADISTQMVLAFVLAGVTAGSTTSMAADRTAATSYQIAVLIPLAVRMLMQGGAAHFGMCLMTLLYLTFLIITIFRLNIQIVDNIAMRFQAERREAALRDSELRYRELAHADALTGLPNRHSLHQTLPALLAAEGSRGRLAVMYFDVDNFKDINDSHGHGFGDRILTALAERLRDSVRPQDMVVRMGGDEFVIIARDVVDHQSIEHLAQSILAHLEQPIMADSVAAQVRASIGIGVFPEDGADAEELMKNADIALYQAKARGRSCYQFFTADMNESFRERIFLERDLRSALRTEQIFVEYQPLVDLQGDRPPELEALLRWHHPERGLVPPAKFIPIAEHCGLMNELGEEVLRLVCRQLRSWLDDLVPVVPVAINVSPRQFDSGGLAKLVAGIAGEYQIDPTLLHIEITESALMVHSQNVLSTLRSLRAMGIKISVDDFGTGYSSLSYLKHLPIDCLKIDRSFINDMSNDRRDVALVRGIIGIAASLSMRVVAEGVETRQQALQLRELNCHAAQGYYFHRPMSADKCRALLTSIPGHRSLADTIRTQALRLVGAVSRDYGA